MAVPEARLHVGPEGAGPQVGHQRVASTSPMPASPHRSRATPPNSGTEAPHTPLRPPAGVTGTRAPSHRASTAATWAVSVGRATTAGRAGTSPAAAQPMASGHQSRPASARSASSTRHAAQASARRWTRSSSTATRPPSQVVDDVGRRRVDRGHRASVVAHGRRLPAGPAARRLVATAGRSPRRRDRGRPGSARTRTGHRRRPRPRSGDRSSSQPSSGPMSVATRRRRRAAARASRQRRPGPAVEDVGDRARPSPRGRRRAASTAR